MSNPILAALKKHSKAPPSSFIVGERLLAERDAIEAARLEAGHVLEKMAAADVRAAAELDTVASTAEAEHDNKKAEALMLAERDRAARSAEHKTLADCVDAQRLRETADPDEMRALLADADAFGGEIGQAARRIAMPRIKEFAISDRRNLNSKWFALLCASNVPRTNGNSRAEIEARFDAERKAIRSAVAAVADAVGIGVLFRRASVTAAITTPPRVNSGIIVGEFWERLERKS